MSHTEHEKNLIQLAGRLAFVLHRMRNPGDPDKAITGGITFALYDDMVKPDVDLALALVESAKADIGIADDEPPDADDDSMRGGTAKRRRRGNRAAVARRG